MKPDLIRINDKRTKIQAIYLGHLGKEMTDEMMYEIKSDLNDHLIEIGKLPFAHSDIQIAYF